MIGPKMRLILENQLDISKQQRDFNNKQIKSNEEKIEYLRKDNIEHQAFIDEIEPLLKETA